LEIWCKLKKKKGNGVMEFWSVAVMQWCSGAEAELVEAGCGGVVEFGAWGLELGILGFGL
jgi:hypothetical protein